MSFFARIRRTILPKKLKKVGPFECDELEKHCRVSAKCYPTKLRALYTMAKEKFNAVCGVSGSAACLTTVEKSIAGDE